MAETDDIWSSNANEAFNVVLMTPRDGKIKQVTSYHPKFTYPIFGEEERIFGYKNLRINLLFNSSDMRPNLNITYSKKFQAIGETEPADIPEILKDFLPPVAFQPKKEFQQAVLSMPVGWTPPGDKFVEFVSPLAGGQKFEVRAGNLGDPAIKQLLSRVQILSSLFIEGGTPIDVDEDAADRWTVFFLYTVDIDESSKSDLYVFGGYCTVYRFNLFQLPSPPSSPAHGGDGQPAPKDDLELGDGNFDLSQLPCRSRISQFVITPPFQSKGVGSQFYRSIYGRYLHHPQTVEMTVEDPNEAFDDMRDLCDLNYLASVHDFTDLRINTGIPLPRDGAIPTNIIDPETVEKIRRKAKIAPRQFARMVEMQLMSELPPSVRPDIPTEGEEKPRPKAKAGEEHQYHLWKLLVKARLYRQHKDVLGQLEPAERVEKLDQTVASVEFEYVRLLELFEQRMKNYKAAFQEAWTARNLARDLKRKSSDEEDKDSADEPSSKRARVEESEG